MLSVKNISEVAVAMKFDQDHQNWQVNVKFKGGYPEAKLEKISPKTCPSGTQNKSFRRIR